MNDPAGIRRVLESEGSFLIASHTGPDGDALGSSLALASWLRRRGARCIAVAQGGVPELYRFLPGAEAVQAAYPLEWDGAVVVLDTPDPARTGMPDGVLAGARLIVNIDHHPDNGGFGDAALVDATASATALLVYEVVATGDARFRRDEATLLYAGLFTDTGGFRFDNTDARTLAAAARLAELGAETARVARAVYGSMELRDLRLLGRVLSAAETLLEGRLGLLCLTAEMKASAGTDGEGIEELASFGRLLGGAEVAALLREEDGRVRVSLRSVRGADVNRVARALGGGGHHAAAGVVLPTTLAEARLLVRDAVSAALREAEAS